MPLIGALEQRAVGYGGLVLRYGMFYGPHTHFVPGGQFFEEVRRRRMPIPGTGTGVCSFIHVDDAAAATVAALERPDVAGVLNVTDDDPIAMPTGSRSSPRAIGAPKPLRVPGAGRQGSSPARCRCTSPRRCRARERPREGELGWAPAYPSVREGFRAEPTALERIEYTT